MADHKDHSAGAGNFAGYIETHPFSGQPANLYEAMNYIMQLGGKRLRPQLLLLAYESVKGSLDEQAMKLALSIETFHNFSLVHDDIMDNAPVRRGKPTVHEQWDSGTAILAGDNLLIYCYRLMLDCHFENKLQLLDVFTDMATQVCDGQQMDMNLPGLDRMTEDVYLEMIRLKTAVLPACALKMGAMAAGADAEIAHHFYLFGLNLGMAFQLQDDYLDCFGSPEETGKQEGGDIIENKKTLLYLHAMQHLGAEAQTELSGWFSKDAAHVPDKLRKVRQLFKDAESDVYVLYLKAQYEKEALEHLQKACSENRAKAGLIQLFEFLKTRKV
jgi:geranylgeranyl diphosphate synthase type II